MAREIKFRTWDKVSEKWLDQEEYVIDPEDGAVGEVSSYEIVDVNYDAVLEQYTGLNDKNGVEIYENDIVSCSMGCPHQVVWKEEMGGMFLGGMPGWYLSGLSDGYAWTKHEKVIGNIHENPELLEE